MIPGTMPNVGTEGERVEGLLVHAAAAIGRGDLAGANALYLEILAGDPDHVLALRQRGALVLARGDAPAALALFERAKAKTPADADINHAIATALRSMGRADAAQAALDAALALDPAHGPSLYDRALEFQQSGAFDEAAALYSKLVAQEPVNVRAALNYGAVLYRLDDLAAAERQFRRAARHDPAGPLPLINLAMIQRTGGAVQEAIATLERAVALTPDNAEVRWNLANALLLSGDFPRGFAAYEWRFRRAGHEEKARGIPRWSGEALAGKTIVLTVEQGVGDLIQFIRFAPDLAACGAQVVVECHPGLASLIATAPGVTRAVTVGTPTPDADVYLPLLSLPLLLGLTLATIPAPVPYFSVPAATPSFASGERFKVGLVWRGNPAHENDRWRSVPLALLAPLHAAPGVTFFSLQIGGAAEANQEPWRDVLHDLAPRLTDFAATAAAISALDLVITVDTAVAHLAGALGKPAWVLIAQGNDWRWLQTGDTSPWYPTLRLFRQRPHRDWMPAVQELTEALEKMASAAS